MVNDITITVLLSGADLDRVKVADLATSVGNTYLAIEMGAATDTVGNMGQAVVLQAGDLVLDDTPPVLESFDFDLDSGMITLSFSEAVNITNFMLNEIVLAEEQIDTTDVTNFSPLDSTFSYTSPMVFRDIVIILSPDELNEIKRIQVCRDNVSCYLYFPQMRVAAPAVVTVTDIAGNMIEPIQFLKEGWYLSSLLIQPLLH